MSMSLEFLIVLVLSGWEVSGMKLGLFMFGMVGWFSGMWEVFLFVVSSCMVWVKDGLSEFFLVMSLGSYLFFGFILIEVVVEGGSSGVGVGLFIVVLGFVVEGGSSGGGCVVGEVWVFLWDFFLFFWDWWGSGGCWDGVWCIEGWVLEGFMELLWFEDWFMCVVGLFWCCIWEDVWFKEWESDVVVMEVWVVVGGGGSVGVVVIEVDLSDLVSESIGNEVVCVCS